VIMGQRSRRARSAAGMIIQKGRLQPGRMFLIDTEQAASVRWGVENKVATEHPYQVWLNRNHVLLEDLPEPPHVHEPDTRRCSSASRRSATRSRRCGLFSAPMASTACSRLARWARTAAGGALEPAAIALQLFQTAFRAGHQPAIDPIREKSSPLGTMLGSEGNLLQPRPKVPHDQAGASHPHQRGS